MGRVHKKKIAEFIGADIGSDAEAMDESDASGGASEENGSDNRRKRIIEKKADEVDADNLDSDTSVTSDKRQKSVSKSSSVDKGDEDTTKENDDSNKKQSRKSSVKTKRGAGKDNAASEVESTTDEAPKKRARKTAAKEKTVVEEDDDEEEAEPEPEYEVEAVIDKKVEKGATYYLLTWKGYPKEDATWEPEDSISCPELVEKFNKKRAAESTKGSKKAADASKKGAAKKEQKKTASSKAAKAKNGGQADGNEGETTEYEVEKIVDYSNEKSGRIFRIRWKGYRPKHDTWEPEDNLTCPDLIEKFMKQVKQQEDHSRELREEPKKTKFLVDETQPRTSFRSRIERSSQRSCARQRKFYGDAEN